MKISSRRIVIPYQVGDCTESIQEAYAYLARALLESLELPGDLPYSELHFWQATKDKVLLPPKKVAWMTS